MKIHCADCLMEVKVTEYPIGIYVEPCENCAPDEEEIADDNFTNGEEKGYAEAHESSVQKLELFLETYEDPKELKEKLIELVAEWKHDPPKN